MGLIIDIENKRLKLEKLNDFSAHGESYIASVTAAELLTGVHLANDISIKLRRQPL